MLLRWRSRRAIASGLVLLGIVTFLCTAPLYWLSNGYLLGIGAYAMYLALLAATWSFLAGVGGQFSFAHVALAGLAVYASGIWGRDVSGNWGSVYLSIGFGVAFAGTVGLCLGLLLLRLRSAYLALFTIAFAVVVQLVVIAEAGLTGGPYSLPLVQLPGGAISHYYLTFGLLIAMLVVIYWLSHTRIGLYTRAMREDEQAAAAMGVNIVRTKVLLFVVTSLMVGLGAGVYFHTTPRVSPEQLDILSMGFVAAAAVIGGIDSPLAAALGGLVTETALEALRELRLDADVIHLIAAGGAATALAAAIGLMRGSAGRRTARRVLAGSAPVGLVGLAAFVASSYLVGRSHTLTSIGIVAAAAALWAVSRFVRSVHSAAPLLEAQQIVRFALVGAAGLAIFARLVTLGSVDVTLGVWRFAMFGVVVMVTLRFARNGLVTPLLEGLSPRHSRVVEARRSWLENRSVRTELAAEDDRAT